MCECSYLRRYAVDEITAQVESAQIVHLEHLGRYLPQPLVVEPQDVDRVGVTHILQRLVDLVALGVETEDEPEKKTRRELFSSFVSQKKGL